MPPSTIIDIEREHPAHHGLFRTEDGGGVFVIICRYINEPWLAALERIPAGSALYLFNGLKTARWKNM